MKGLYTGNPTKPFLGFRGYLPPPCCKDATKTHPPGHLRHRKLYAIEKTMKNTIPPSGASLATRLAGLQQALKAAAGDSLAKHTPPLLIGVSKTHPAETIHEAITAGLTDFGENKVQEAQAKFPAIKIRHPNIRLHLIGPLQSNKVKEAVALFDVIHTIDRAKIADAIKAEIEKQNRKVTCLIQINIGEEEQKSGVALSELEALLKHCQAIGLKIDGLMCIPPATKNPAPYFALMQKLKQTHELAELSMGMSGDYLTAIRFGATMVRVGTALFGERNS